MKAATFAYDRKAKISLISIHAAREGGDAAAKTYADAQDISIHAAREGGDRNIQRNVT